MMENIHTDFLTLQATAGLNGSSHQGPQRMMNAGNGYSAHDANVKNEKMKPGNSAFRLKSDIFEASVNGKQ